MSDDNIWSNEWGEQGEDWSGGGGRGKRLPRGDHLGASVYELDPGNFVVYHFHHGSEELLVVLRGQMTLRTPDGEREVSEGEVVHFPVGPDGTHAFYNRGEQTVRYLMASSRHIPALEVVEYPDLRQITAQAVTASMTGERLWLVYDVPEESDA
jgi:uncharacterized cupin superfamily protein